VFGILINFALSRNSVSVARGDAGKQCERHYSSVTRINGAKSLPPPSHILDPPWPRGNSERTSRSAHPARTRAPLPLSLSLTFLRTSRLTPHARVNATSRARISACRGTSGQFAAMKRSERAKEGDRARNGGRGRGAFTQFRSFVETVRRSVLADEPNQKLTRA